MFIIKEKGGINMINVNKVGEFITLKRKEKRFNSTTIG